MSHRLAQVNELLRHELGLLIQRELETPNCLVTITAVHTSPDLAEATVTITVIPENYTGSTLEKINKRATMLHSLLNKRVQMRKTPKLHFVLDTAERRAQNVEYTLDSLRDEHATPHLQLTKILKAAHHVAILTHRKPDGDAWGSMVALSAICDHFGRPATWYSPDHLVSTWPHLTIDTNAKHVRRADVILVADCSDWRLTGWDRDHIHPQAVIINIDHHSSNAYFGHYNWVEDQRSSVCEMLTELLNAMDFNTASHVSMALTIGILSDTGNFTNGATTSSSLRTCAQLLRHGVSWSDAFHQLWQDHDHRVLAVWGRAFQRLMLDDATNSAHTYLQPDDLAHLPPDVATAATDGLANFLNHLHDPSFVMVACNRGNDCKISFRTNKPDVDVRAIAALFGGGGHIKAAGCTVSTTGPMDQLLPQLLAQMPRA